VVQVGYLETAEAVKLLRRRVAALPVPFGCLCHCLAGGLPRDLIRACRSLYLLAPKAAGRTLTELAMLLIEEDFGRKRHAIELSAKQLDIEQVSDFLMAMRGLEHLEPSVDLLDRHAAVFAAGSKLSDAEPSSDERRLAGLSMEFGCYLLYCATLIAFFGDQLNEAAVRIAEQSGAFEALAKARQMMSLDPKLSWQLCAEFRRTIGIKSPSPNGDDTAEEPALKARKVRRRKKPVLVVTATASGASAAAG
jgi:hypothetical protein